MPKQMAPLTKRRVRGSATGRPIMALLDLLGRRWSLRILWELRDAPLTSRRLRAACDEASPTVLQARLSELRQAGQFVPTLMLTARGHPEDVLKGFSAGADDYLAKPFDLSILIARIRGLLRRREWLVGSIASPTAAPPPSDAFTFGDKTIDFQALELRDSALEGGPWSVLYPRAFD